MVISSRKSSGRGSNKQTNKPLLRRASPFLRLSIFTYDPASIARTVFHTPSSRIVKRISTPTRRKISLVDDKKKKKKENRGREISKSPPKWFTRVMGCDFGHTPPRNCPIRKLREKATSSFIIEHSFLRSIEGEKTREGGWPKTQGGVRSRRYLISNPFLSRAKNFTKTNVYILSGSLEFIMRPLPTRKGR